MPFDPQGLLEELICIPGPPGQEGAVREALARHLDGMGLMHRTDAKGNLLVQFSDRRPRIVVTAHMDEIAMVVRGIEDDGTLTVGPLGGLHPWKLGEGPVSILPLATGDEIPGILSFGGVHTEAEGSVAEHARSGAMEWEHARVVTGLDIEDVFNAGVRPGCRVVIAPSRRGLTPVGELVAGYFLDDRADLVSWLMALEGLKGTVGDLAFVATASEETGGEGALYYLHEYRPEVCIALELGPHVPDAPVSLSADPTLWVSDSYATMMPADIALVEQVASGINLDIQFQALSRGGSDATCAASHGLCARPITLGLPMENSHGYEVIHPGSMEALSQLTVGLVRELLI